LTGLVTAPTVGYSGGSDGNGMTGCGGGGNVGNFGRFVKDGSGEEKGGCDEFMGFWDFGDGRSSWPVRYLL